MVENEVDLKRWAIYDSEKERVYNISDSDFNLGVISNGIKLTGKFIEFNKQKIWIDGIIKK